MSDLLVCVFHIPVIITITGCRFSSYAEALYFAHLGWTLLGISQAMGTYTILWLSLDRFIAIWFYNWYPKIQQKPGVTRNRMLVTALLCVFFHLIAVIDAEVYCSNPQESDGQCTDGEWVSVSGYGRHFDEVWHKVYLGVLGLFIRWVPCAFLLVFNVGLVVGVVRGRITFPAAQESARGGEKTLIATTIAITASYILLTFPITVYIMGYNTHVDNRCSGRHPKEVLRAVGNVLQLLEHVVHIVFLIGLYHGFRRELKILLRLERRGEAAAGTVHKEGHVVNLSQYGGGGPLCLTLPSITPDTHSSTRPTLVDTP